MKCTICQQPILQGEGRYTAADDNEADTSQHWHCAFPNGGPKTPREMAKEVDRLMSEATKALDKLGSGLTLDSTATTPRRRRK